MRYVKHLIINDVDVRQVACIELHGAPNAATVGAFGLLGIDVDSPSHEMYKCVAVNGGVYTWEICMGGGSQSGVGSLSVTDDGVGNVTVSLSGGGSLNITDDGDGNVTMGVA